MYNVVNLPGGARWRGGVRAIVRGGGRWRDGGRGRIVRAHHVRVHGSGRWRGGGRGRIVRAHHVRVHGSGRWRGGGRYLRMCASMLHTVVFSLMENIRFVESIHIYIYIILHMS